MLGRPNEALEIADDVLRTEPEIPLGLVAKARALTELGRTAEALRLMARLKQLHDDGRINPNYFWPLESAVTAATGDEHRRHAALERLAQWAERAPPDDLQSPQVCLWLLKYRRDEQALQVLERQRSPYDVLILRAEFARLKGNARFTPILQRAKKDFDEAIGVLQEGDSRGELPRYLDQPLADLFKELGVASTPVR